MEYEIFALGYEHFRLRYNIQRSEADSETGLEYGERDSTNSFALTYCKKIIS